MEYVTVCRFKKKTYMDPMGEAIFSSEDKKPYMKRLKPWLVNRDPQKRADFNPHEK